MPKYPNITIKLSTCRNDRFLIVMACLQALNKYYLGHELKAFSEDLKNSSDLVTTVKKWFNVE